MTSPFTLDNIPYGVISTADNPRPRCATAYKDYAVDLSLLEEDGFFDSILGFKDDPIFSQPTLNIFAALPKDAKIETRKQLIKYLADEKNVPGKYTIPLDKVQNHYPMATSNFSDFFCSLEHARNCAEAINAPFTPNFFAIPSVYNGRTSSLKITNTPIRRPWGVIQPTKNDQPTFTPSQRLDFELEMGVFISKPFPAGEILDIRRARDHIFGFVIMNDWSARDIQGFEIVPLGPFHSKGSGTSVSPWVVTVEALEGVKCGIGVERGERPLEHLRWKGNESEATFDIRLEARIIRNGKSYTVTSTNVNELYWTPYQQLTHLTSAGEGLSTGDIFGTGTVTSSRVNEHGEKTGIACLIERTLPKNELSELKKDGVCFLHDGDEVVMEGWCLNPKTGVRFGFGECRGRIIPALELSSFS